MTISTKLVHNANGKMSLAKQVQNLNTMSRKILVLNHSARQDIIGMTIQIYNLYIHSVGGNYEFDYT